MGADKDADSEIDRLVKELHRLLPDAKTYPFVHLFPDAKEHDCHRNVDAFVAANESYRVARGWLFFDFRMAALFGMSPFLRFSAHSLVEDKNGQRFDITPSRASQQYPFIEHPFGDEDFTDLITKHRMSHLDVEV
ncbi:MAG: hypothetical protein GY844_19315 [Bradyrhizobium sp.]|nr:hypothetical protein [Bradyrhizobium sp.]